MIVTGSNCTNHSWQFQQTHSSFISFIMRNYQWENTKLPSVQSSGYRQKKPIFWRYFDDIFQNINGVLRKTIMLSTTCATWNTTINSIDPFSRSFLGSSVQRVIFTVRGGRFLFRFLCNRVLPWDLGPRYTSLSLRIHILKCDLFSWGCAGFTSENVPSILEKFYHLIEWFPSQLFALLFMKNYI